MWSPNVIESYNIHICTYTSSWIYEKVLSENISTLTKILLNRVLNKSNGPKSNEKEQKEGKERGEQKKTEHSYVFILSTLEIHL